MYHIINIKTGEIIAAVDDPLYIRLQENGSFGETDELNAQGIAVNGTPYNLPPREAAEDWAERKPMEGVTGTVVIRKVDGGEYLLRQQNAVESMLVTMLEDETPEDPDVDETSTEETTPDNPEETNPEETNPEKANTDKTRESIKEALRSMYQNKRGKRAITLNGLINAAAKNMITAGDIMEIAGFADNIGAIDDDPDNEVGSEKAAEKLNLFRALKLREIGRCCSTAIYAGVDVGGAHYSLSEHDQIELMAQLSAVKEGAELVPYHADGELCRMFTPTEFNEVANAAMSYIYYHRTYCNHLNTWIKRASLDELDSIYYGAELPTDLAENMTALLTAAGGDEA